MSVSGAKARKGATSASRSVVSQRPQSADSGHSPGRRRTAQLDPNGFFHG